MSLKMHVYDRNGEGYDISEIVHSIEYTTSILGQPGKLSFIVEKDPNDILQMALGNMIKFWTVDEFKQETGVFQGYIFNIGTDGTEAYRVLAYDQMRYLQNHDDWDMSGKSLPEVFEYICGKCQLNYEVFAIPDRSTKVNEKIFIDASYFEMLQYAIDWTNTYQRPERTNDLDIGVYWYIRDNFGTLQLREVKYCSSHDENRLPVDDYLIIGDESLLMDYQYEVDIDKNTFNEFYFTYNDKSKAAATTNTQVQRPTPVGAIQAGTPISGTNTSLDGQTIGDDTIPKWGKLRKYVSVNDISDKDLLAEYMRLNVEHFNEPGRSIKLSALGYDGIYAGSTFVLRLKKLEIDYMVYVISATHKYDGDTHTMDLEINTNSGMNVLC